MEYLNAKYLAKDGENVAIHCERNGAVLGVPIDPSNSDYAEIMRQVEAGELVIQDAES